jgi:hypothetical protein
MLADPKQPA